MCEDGAAWLMTDLNPGGGLYGGGALNDTLHCLVSWCVLFL